MNNKLFICFSIIFVFFLGVNNVNAQNTEKEQLAMQYFKAGQYDKAAVVYQELFDKTKTNYIYSYYLESLLIIKDYEQAEITTKKMVRSNSSSLYYRVDLAYVRYASGQTKKATKEFNNLIDDLRADRRKISELANAFSRRRLFEYAEKTYLKGRKLMGKDYGFHFELASIYMSSGQNEKMVEEYLNQLAVNETYLKTVQVTLHNVISASKDEDIAMIVQKNLINRINTDSENPLWSEMLIWIYIQEKDFEMAFFQAKAIDKRFKEDGEKVFAIVSIASNNNDFEVVIKACNYLLTKGEYNIFYFDARLALLNASYQQITSRVDYSHQEMLVLIEEYNKTLKELGYNHQTAPLMKNYAHLKAFYENDTEQAILILNRALAFPNLQDVYIAELKIELADIYLISDQIWEASLLYSQVEKALKNEPIGHLAKLKNAKLFYYAGEFLWAKSHLDILKAATSKLIANDAMQLSMLISDNMNLIDSSYNELEVYSRADLLFFKNQYQEALKTLDSVSMLSLAHPLKDEVLYKKAEINIKIGEYETADSLLLQLYTNFNYDILADDALFLRAKLQQEYFHNYTLATELYEKLMMEFSSSIYAVDARKKYRELTEE